MPALNETLRDAAVAALRQTELRELVGSPFLDLIGHLTLRELLGSPAKPRGRPHRAGGRPATSTGARPKKPNVRSATGRQAYDGAVLAAVEAHDGPVRIEAILDRAGGDMAQARASLHRLTEDRKVQRTGKARGTRYSARPASARSSKRRAAGG